MPKILSMDLRTLEIKIARSENLPALPQVVTQVLRMADDPNVSSRAVEQVIERDSAMTAKVLRVANSSYYANGNVPSIGRAISLLGLNALRSLVVSVAYHQMTSGKSSAQKFDKKQFWQHSLAVATASRILGKLKIPAKSEELYGAGMMHDIGLLALDKFAPEALDEALAIVMRESTSVHKALLSTLGYDQSHVGGVLAKQWNLSPIMCDALKYLFDPLESENLQSTTIVSVANYLAHQAGYHNNSTIADEGFTSELLGAIDLQEAQVDAIIAVVKAEVGKAGVAFGIR